MIDPTTLPVYDFPQHKLEEMALFCVAAAGHNAISSAKAVDQFLTDLAVRFDVRESLPFSLVRILEGDAGIDGVRHAMKRAGIGCHGMKSKAFVGLASMEAELTACTLADLEAIPGIGMKTSRFFLLHTRPGAEVAVLDVHILRWLSSLGYAVTKTTPNSPVSYRKVEEVFLKEAKKRNMTPAALDIQIWNQSSGHSRPED